MTATNMTNASADAQTGIDMVPASVPPGWTGKAASNCQLDLDAAQLLLSGLDSLLTEASNAAAALDSASYQCLGPS